MKRATPARPRAWWRDPVLLGLLALGLGLRLWYLSIHNGRSAFFADEGDYYARAINMAFGGGYVDDFWLIRPPLVVFWLAGLFKLTALAGLGAHLLLVARLVQIALSLAVLVLLYDTGRTLYGVTAGRWAAGGWAVLYSFVKLPSLLLVENIFLALVTVFFWALARYERRPADRRGWGWLALAGAALGVAALSRSTLIWFLPAVGLWLWLIERQRRPGQRVKPFAVLGRWLAVAGVMAALVAPWTLRNYRLYGSFIPVDTMLGANLWLDADELDSRRGDNPKLAALQSIEDPVARDAYGRQQGLATIAADPLAKLGRSWAQVRHALRLEFLANFFDRPSLDSEPLRAAWPLAAPGDLLTLALVLLLIWSAFSPAIAGPFKLGALLWVGLNLAAIVVFHSETRYLLPIYHVALLLGGGSIARAQSLVAGWRLLGAMAAMFAVVLVVMTYKPYPALLDSGLDREFALADG
ncbi:MAG TPA: glycosyltransferase family 39 protein, partial [Herpetosiphonaceae bacterium]